MQDQNDQKNEFDDLDFDDDLLDQDFNDSEIIGEQDFADLDDNDWAEENEAPSLTAKKSSKTSSKSSSKLILPALAGVVLLGGGGFIYLTQFGGLSNSNQDIQDAYLLAQQESEISLIPVEESIESTELTQNYDGDSPVFDPNTPEEELIYHHDSTMPEPELDLASQPLTPFPEQSLEEVGLQEIELQNTETSDTLPLEDIGLNDLMLSEAEPDLQDMGIQATPDESNLEEDISLSLDLQADDPVSLVDDSLGVEPIASVIDSSHDSLLHGSDEGNLVTDAPGPDALELQNQISSLERSLSSKDSAIAQLNDQINALQEKIASQETLLSEKEQKVASLEKEVKEREAAAKNEAQSSISQKPESTATNTQTQNTATITPPASIASKPNVPSQQSTQPVTRSAQSQTSGTTWQLRSAQPGRAYVARADSNDVIMVEVGSTLSGVGRITEISNATGRWIVKGTRGQINQ
ncbi:MAG: hypothetical protein ACK4VI_04720 [Alphaproteobacteria bacterium]